MIRRTCLSLAYTINNSPFRPNQSSLQNPGLKIVEQSNYGSLSSISKERKKISLQNKKKFLETQVSSQLKAEEQLQECEVTLYMKHDNWKSQYVYAMMNYQQMGFTRISDYVFLSDMAKFLQIEKKPENEKWPVMKFKFPLHQNQFASGVKEICDFIDKKHLFLFDVEDNPNLDPAVQKYIDENIAPHLQTLFWHPKLTFEQIFHINLSSFTRVNMNYKLVRIFFGLYAKTFVAVVRNLYKIATNKPRYQKSKQNLQKGLQQVTKMLNGAQFLGGTKPNHLDFYLFATLSTRSSSKHFEQYLKTIGGQFWAWYYRMQRATRYEKERVTLL